jgi:dienelactone hydrolase
LNIIKKLSFILLLLLTFISCKDYVSQLSPLDGPYRTIGTKDIVLDDPRNLLLHVWYPAESVGEGQLEPILTQEMADALAKHMGVPKILKEENLMSRSYKNAPKLKIGHFPVIIFEHGYESYARQNLSQMEKLANNGYVVMALSHPGESIATQYPDGTIELMNKEKYPSLGSLNSKKEKTKNVDIINIVIELMSKEDDPYVKERIFYSALKDYKSVIVVEKPISERKADMVNLLNSLDEINESGDLANLLDLDSIGIYGHSMGGVSAYEAGSRTDLKRLPKAVANLDGPMFFYGEKGPIPKVPFLMAYSTETKWGSGKMSLAGINEWIFGQKTTDAWEATFFRSTHVNFTDLTYFKRLRRLDITGKSNGFSTGVAQEEMLLVFFDKYLKGIEPDIAALREVHDEWEIIIR